MQPQTPNAETGGYRLGFTQATEEDADYANASVS
jgi:hypothetical protein